MAEQRSETARQTGREIEVKLRAGDRAELLRLLRRAGARPLGGRVHEMNVLYDTPRRSLFRRDEALRVRVERPAGRRAAPRALAKRAPAEKPRERSSRGSGGAGEVVTLTYKGPACAAGGGRTPPHGRRKPRGAAAATGASRTTSRYKIRTEEELRVPAAEPLDAVLRASGLEPSFRYEKYRQAFRLPGLPGLVIDLDETPIGVFVELEGSPAAIDRAAARLGYGSADYIVKSYVALYLTSRRASGGASRGASRKAKRQPNGAKRGSAEGMLFPRRRRGAPGHRR